MRTTGDVQSHNSCCAIAGFCVENRYVAAQQEFDKTGKENADLKEWRELQARWNQFGCFVPQAEYIFKSNGAIAQQLLCDCTSPVVRMHNS